MMNSRVKTLATALAAALILSLNGSAWACPTCKEGLGNSAHLVAGYGWSIVFMMSAPFVIMTVLGAYFYYEVRKAHRANALRGDVASTPAAT